MAENFSNLRCGIMTVVLRVKLCLNCFMFLSVTYFFNYPQLICLFFLLTGLPSRTDPQPLTHGSPPPEEHPRGQQGREASPQGSFSTPLSYLA